MRIIDLSHAYKVGMTLFPGTPAIDIKQIAQIDEGGYRVTDFHAGAHVGTHCDAFGHVIKGAKLMDEIPLDTYIGEAIVVDAPVEDELEIPAQVLEGYDIKPGDIVLIRTGYGKLWDQPQYVEKSPHFSEELAHKLVELKIKAVGMDIISPDTVDSTAAPVHHILMGNEIGIVENLNNLDQLDVERVFFAAAPILIDKSDGGFTRAFAVIKE
ncbi:MAG TPA: cyclase family protein [bacterium]|nr:cyclase family protein [bacterium]